MKVAFMAPSFKNSSYHIPKASDIQAKGLRKDLKENTQGLGVCPERRESDTQSCPHPPGSNRSACPSQLPTSTHPLSSSMESEPTLKEFSSAKFKIMSLRSLVVFVASNTWEESPWGLSGEDGSQQGGSKEGLPGQAAAKAEPRAGRGS